MTSLDSFYAQILHVGFVVLRQAIESGNQEWMAAEIEMLHNVPSLLGEENIERHRYYWLKERTHYLEWVNGPGRDEAKSRMLTFYNPIWSEMASHVDQLLCVTR